MKIEGTEIEITLLQFETILTEVLKKEVRKLNVMAVQNSTNFTLGRIRDIKTQVNVVQQKCDDFLKAFEQKGIVSHTNRLSEVQY